MKKKRQALTLIEMMLVILLVGVVGGALAFNIKGAILKGKQFKTEEMRKKIDSVLNLALLEGYSSQEIQKDWVKIVKNSPLIQVKGSQELLYDAWGNPFEVQITSDGQSFSVTSKALAKDEEILF